MTLLSAGVSVRRLGRYTRTLLFILFFGSCFVWLPFFCGCLVGLLSQGYFAPLLRPGEGVCRGLCLLAFHLCLPALVVPFCRVSFGLCAFLVVLPSVCCGFFLFVLFLLLLLFFVLCSVALLVFVLGAWGCCGFARSLLLPPPAPPPLVGPLVPSGPVSALLVPPSGYLVVPATARLPYLWSGVLWLIGSCLHSSSWQQRPRPCVGLCPLHHVVGVDLVPLAPALRYLPLGDPEPP